MYILLSSVHKFNSSKVSFDRVVGEQDYTQGECVSVCVFNFRLTLTIWF